MWPKTFKRFAKDDRGNFALTFAIGATVTIGIIGASVDFSMSSTAAKRSQQIADAVALNGAVFIKNHGYVPKSRGADTGGLPAGQYSASELGLEFNSFVEGGAEGVTVNIDYNDSAKEILVEVSGSTQTTFTRVLGKETVAFSSEAVVSYLNIEEASPASIALVLDNSGSMAWDDRIANSNGTSPAGAEVRLDGLKASVTSFQTSLSDRLGVQTAADYRTLRMGLLPYSSNTISSAVVDIDWGYIETDDINAMNASGSTNSNPPMATALEWFEDEDDVHEDEAERAQEDNPQEPLKFVILMSDGENTIGGWEFFPNDEAPVYWRYRNGRWSGVWAQWYSPVHHADYTRGDLRRDSDRLTIESCNSLKEDHNTEIFTIGYALEEGRYNTRNPSNNRSTYQVNAWTRANAENLLSSCASSDEHFIWARDSDELQAAFNRIQNAIVEELIRIKS